MREADAQADSQALIDATAGETYRFKRCIGQGGMGVLYEVTQKGKSFVVKIPHPALKADPLTLARFEREGRLGKELGGTHIVKVLDYCDEQARPFILMEYLDGKDLASAVKAHGSPSDWVRTVEWIAQAADGIHVVHMHENVHRDIKPSNLFLTAWRNGDDLVKVIDFGLAKKVGEPADEVRTDTGKVVGTPVYMSPEQLTGKNVGTESDVYSLAVVLYELLAEKRPHDEASYLVATTTPKELREVARTRIPDGLSAIVMKALSLDPEKRVSAEEFATRLKAILSEERERRRAGSPATLPEAECPLPSAGPAVSEERERGHAGSPAALPETDSPLPQSWQARLASNLSGGVGRIRWKMVVTASLAVGGATAIMLAYPWLSARPGTPSQSELATTGGLPPAHVPVAVASRDLAPAVAQDLASVTQNAAEDEKKKHAAAAAVEDEKKKHAAAAAVEDEKKKHAAAAAVEDERKKQAAAAAVEDERKKQAAAAAVEDERKKATADKDAQRQCETDCNRGGAAIRCETAFGAESCHEACSAVCINRGKVGGGTFRASRDRNDQTTLLTNKCITQCEARTPGSGADKCTTRGEEKCWEYFKNFSGYTREDCSCNKKCKTICAEKSPPFVLPSSAELGEQ